MRSLAFAGPSQIFAALKRSTGVNPPNFVGRRSTVKILLHLSYLIGGTDDTHGHLLYANPSYGMFSASWPFLRRLGGGRCPGIWRRPSKLFAGHCRLRGCAGNLYPNSNELRNQLYVSMVCKWCSDRSNRKHLYLYTGHGRFGDMHGGLERGHLCSTEPDKKQWDKTDGHRFPGDSHYCVARRYNLCRYIRNLYCHGGK